MTEDPTPPEPEAEHPAPAEQPATPAEQPAAPAEQPAAPEQRPAAAPAAEQPAPPAEQDAAPAEQPATPAEQDAAPAEQPPPPEQQPAAPAAEQPPPPEQQPAAAPAAPAAAEQPPAPRKRARSRPRRPAQVPRREKGPLPINELRDAARAASEAYGARRALRDAFSLLGAKERSDLSALVSADDDHRPRARNIATGSLGAGRLGKAIAAQQIAMARTEDLWTLTLSKEEAAEKLARVRGARQRDERRAQRDSERAQRSDRVSRAELAAAQDGRVGAQIRIVGPDGEEQPKPAPAEGSGPQKKKGSSVLDRLGY
jgi:hypothetical protein